ncbi:MAG TPA: heme ABC exporter ATP-binding protein CcmA [Rickettsiales bacterium]|nr:heme ABC exporter ATP-binding protein CcmA [Rickettsiales bacterium]
MLSVENLGFYRNDQKIFTNLGFSLFLNAALVVVGKNGSGKTSLLKIIAGLFKESSGKILWDEQNITDFRDDFNGDIQFLGHKNFLKQELSVFENLKFYADLTDSKILIPSALKIFDLEEFANKKIKELSNGWQKRVMLAKLVACPATIWILDEPTINLDSQGKKIFCDLVKTKIANQGMAIIATHEPELFDFAAKINMEDYL